MSYIGKHRRDIGNWRRRSIGRVALALGSAGALAIGTSGAAYAAVTTDSQFYNAGDTVQIHGDGMASAESVRVDVVNPGGTLAQEHFVQSDASGNFADTYTLPSSAGDGLYGVLAVGTVSHHIYRSTFDPSVQVDCLQFESGPTGNLSHAPVTPQLTGVTTGIRVSWYDQCTDENGFNIYRTDDATLAANFTGDVS